MNVDTKAHFEQWYSSLDTVKQKITDILAANNVSFSMTQEGPGAKKNDAAFDTASAQDMINAYQQLNALIEQYNWKAIEAAQLSNWSDKIYSNMSSFTKLKLKISELKNKLREAQKEKDKLNGGVDKLIDGFKRAVLALVGVRSIFMAIRKSMSAYLAQNEELQQKLNGAFYALGSLFAPVLEWIVNLFWKVLSYVDAIAKMLGFAGINMSNFGKNTAKAAKEMKQLAGFDEINNLNTNNNSGGGSSFKPNIEPVDVGWLEKIKPIIEWIKDHIDLIIAAIIGMIGAWLMFKLAMLDTKEVMKALNAGIKALGIGLIFAGVYLIIKGIIDYLKDPSWANFGKIIAGIGLAVAGVGVLFGAWPVAVAGALVAVLGVIVTHWDKIKAWLEDTIIPALGPIFGPMVQGAVDMLDGIFKGFKQMFDGIIQFVKGVFSGDWKAALDGLKTIWDGAWKVLTSIFDATIGKLLEVWIAFIQGLWNGFTGGLDLIFGGLVKLRNWFGDICSSIGQTFRDLWNKITTWAGETFGKISGFMSEKFKAGINTVISQINRAINFINNALNWSYGGLTLLGKQIIPSFTVQLGRIPNIPQLAVGTNYVPQDMLAMIHEGEAVVPKKYNPANGGNNEEVVNAINSLIDVVQSKEFAAYISSKEIGRTAVNYINNQSRIMGGGIF